MSMSKWNLTWICFGLGILANIFPVVLPSPGPGGGGSLLSLSLDDISEDRIEWTPGSGNHGHGGKTPWMTLEDNSRHHHQHGNGHRHGHHSGLSLKPSLSLVRFSNKSITCNDGSPAGYYIRTSPYRSTKTWIIFLEGGWYCFNERSCQNRWMRLKNLMTSSGWPQFRQVGGILSSDPKENPYWWNANHVFLPYCSSDTWSGTASGKDSGTPFSFMGALIVDEVIRNLVSFGGLTSDSSVILAGSSAGGTGVMINLDRVDVQLKEIFGDSGSGSMPRVRGIADSGWFIDKVPYSSVDKGNCNDVLLCPPQISLQKGMELWKARIPQSCQESYPGEPWACFFGYKIYPTLRAPLFVFQWLFDEAQMLVNNIPTPALRKEDWDFVYKVGDELKKSLVNVTSVMTPSCISHTVLTLRDWRHVEVNSVHLPRALKCWESGGVIEESNYIPSSRSSQLYYGQDEESPSSLSRKQSHRPDIQRNRPRTSLPPEDDEDVDDLDIFIESNDSSSPRRVGGPHRHRHGHGQGQGQGQGHRNGSKKSARRRRRRKKLEERERRQQQRQKSASVENRHPNSNKHKNNNSKNKNPNATRRNSRHSRRNSQNSANRLERRQGQGQGQQRRVNRNRRWFSLCEGGAGGGGDMRLIEKCSWPQCNKSCPKLLNPLTGEEVEFKDLLKSFGLDMGTMARALGIDLATLDSMDHQVLLQMLTQHA